MRKALLILIIVFYHWSSNAQKSSPVIGDAASLMDLLKKDYNNVNPESRDEEVNSDRGKAVAIFKSYLEESAKKELNGNLDGTKVTALNTAYDTYQNAKDALSAVSKSNITVTDQTLINTQKLINDAKNSSAGFKKAYFDKKCEFDLNEFKNLKSAYGSKNPYLAHMVDLFTTKYTLENNKSIDYFAEKNNFSSVQKTIPFLGGDMAFEMVIDGLSRFLAKRIKEELTVYAIDKIRTYLENPKAENYCYELLVILPQTTNYLKQFEADQLLNFTAQIKQYIEEDLNNLLENAANLKSTPRLKSIIAKNPDLDFAFEGLELIPQLSKIKSPIDYFEILENSRTLVNWRQPIDSKMLIEQNKIIKYNIAQNLRLAAMLAYSMTIVENTEVKFATVDFIANYGNDVIFYFLYFGMLHQQEIKYFNINFYKPDLSVIDFNIGKMMNRDDLKVDSIKNTTENFIFLKANLSIIAENAEKIFSQGILIKKKNKNNEEVKYEEIYNFIDDIILFSEEIVKTADYLLDTKYGIIENGTPEEVNMQDKITPYFNVAKTANKIVLDLSQKKYSNAIIKAIEIPLNFRNADEISKDLLNIDNQIKLADDLNFLSEVIDNQTISKLSVSKKIARLKIAEPRLAVISVKLAEDQKMNTLKAALDLFITYVHSVDESKISELDGKISSLTAAVKLEIDNDSLMGFYGISKSTITDAVEKQLKNNGYSATVQSDIKQKIDAYLTDKYSNLILHNKLETNQATIQAIIAEFLPQFIASNSKINDNKAIKLIYFVNDIAVSKDGKDVEKAIEAFALPVGSSSLKEKANLYFSINAFPGILGGLELTKGFHPAGTIGFTAPVGFYFQPFRSGKKGGTFGFFIPIIDIAAPVRIRMDGDNDTKTLPDFSFDDIFSPGLYFTYGFRKAPFALSLGGQYGPKLRDIPTEDNTGFTSVDSWRIMAGVTIDIPLITLFGKYKD